MARLEGLSIAVKRARVACGIQHGHNDDRADLVTKHLRHGWDGAESTALRDTLCSSGFSLIATGSARAQHLLISKTLDASANSSCVRIFQHVVAKYLLFHPVCSSHKTIEATRADLARVQQPGVHCQSFGEAVVFVRVSQPLGATKCRCQFTKKNKQRVIRS